MGITAASHRGQGNTVKMTTVAVELDANKPGPVKLI